MRQTNMRRARRSAAAQRSDAAPPGTQGRRRGRTGWSAAEGTAERPSSDRRRAGTERQRNGADRAGTSADRRSGPSVDRRGRPARRSNAPDRGEGAGRARAPRDREKPRSTPVQETPVEEFVAGRRPVLEALSAGRPMNKIVIAEGAEGGSLAEIVGKAKAAGVLMQHAPKAHLTSVAGDGHQGVLAYIAPHDYASLEEVIARKTGQPPLVVLLDEVTDPHNLGAVLRTAEGVAAQGIVIPKRRSVPLTGTVAKAAAGALEYVPVARVANLSQAIDQLKRAGYWVVGTAADATTMYTDVDYKGPVVVVIGSEGKGLSRLVQEHCDYLVRLPMLGSVQSLNASVAAGVLLYEVVRQRG